MATFVIAEIGINHNGDMDVAKQMINGAVDAGCDAVKFQKRTIDKVYTQKMLDGPRESPWGTTQREQKEGLEFELDDYREIERYCDERDIAWFASAWDLDSQLFLRQFNCQYNKIASAMLMNYPLIELIAEEKKHTFISTGMHTLEEIDRVVDIFVKAECPFEIMHCNSTYPMVVEDANLAVMETLKQHYDCSVGYSGHESGLAVSVAAVSLGATSIERHITVDRALYGSDQAASVELTGLKHLVGMIRIVEKAIGNNVKRVTDAEMAIREKLAPIPSAKGEA